MFGCLLTATQCSTARTKLPLMKALSLAAAGFVTAALTLAPGFSPVANAEDPDPCPTASTSLTQDGSTYLVTSAADLQLVKENSTQAPRSANYRQTAEINMQQGGSVCIWDKGIDGDFSGTYDGGSFEISGLQVSSSRSYVGLFEEVSGTITNVGFTGSVASTGTSWTYVGGLVGELDGGTVDESYTTGNVTSQSSDSSSRAGGLIGNARDGAQITDSHATGVVSAVEEAGGLVGGTSPTSPNTGITRSYATGDVATTASGGDAGGLVGDLRNANVSKSYATGDVSGVADAQHLGALFATMTNSSATDVFATGGVSGWTRSDNTYGQVGGLVGDTTSSLSETITRAYSATISGMSPSSGSNYDSVGGVAGIVVNTTWDSVAWNSETAPSDLKPIGGEDSVDGVSSYTTSELNDLATFTDSTGLDWNTGGARIADGYDASYTWGICSAANNGYPFLTALYSSDPCSGGGDGGDSTATPQPTYTFTFLTSGGGKCLRDVTVTRFERFTLPPSTVACTPLGTSLVGWSIPGQDWAFHPGRVVTVVDSQTFTAVAREPRIDITYDSNINMVDECVREDANITVEADRMDMVETPRRGPSALLATSAPCSPPGFELIGWTDANTPEGSGQAQSGAATYVPGATVPGAWNLDTTNPVNAIRLYALWGRIGE